MDKTIQRGPKVKTPRNAPRQRVEVDLSAYEPPDYLTGLARDEYIRVVRALYDAGSLHKTDRRLIEAYAINYDLIRQAYDTVSKQGTTVESDRGNISEHPSIGTINAATIRLKSIINDFGFTPSAWRHAVGSVVDHSESAEPLAKLVKMAE